MPAMHWETDGEKAIRRMTELEDAAYAVGQAAQRAPLLRYAVNTVLILVPLTLIVIAVVDVIMYGGIP